MYAFRNIQHFEKNDILNQVTLVLINPLHTPIHLALVVNGRFYELNIKGVKTNYTINEKINSFEKVSMPLLFLEFDEKYLKDIKKTASEIFNSYSSVSEDGSCLQPIITFLAENINLDFYSCNVIFDVVEMLIRKNIAFKTYHLHLDTYIENASFHVPHYSHQEVKKYIQKIKKENEGKQHA